MTKKINDKYLSNAKESIRQYEKTLHYPREEQDFCSSISCDDCILYKANPYTNFTKCRNIESAEQRYKYLLAYVKNNSFKDNIYQEEL